jgi:hypothetical protein
LGSRRLLRATEPPQLSGDEAGRVMAMVAWFKSNFEDPANSLPYSSDHGGYQWLWGGPYDAWEELQEAFPEAEEGEISLAVDFLERQAAYWAPADWRTIEPPHEGFGRWRYGHDNENPNGNTIIETILYPQRVVGWSLHATFIPGRTNSPLGNELDGIIDDLFPSEIEQRTFASVREMVIHLVQSVDPSPPTFLRKLEKEASLEWLSSLTRDSEIFTADSVIVHGSDPRWEAISRLGGKAVDATAITGVVITAPSFESGALLLLAFGGSRIFLRLVRNTETTIDTMFERLQQRISSGKWREEG